MCYDGVNGVDGDGDDDGGMCGYTPVPPASYSLCAGPTSLAVPY